MYSDRARLRSPSGSRSPSGRGACGSSAVARSDDRIKCFLLERSEEVEISLRRFRFADGGPPCTAPPGYHDGSHILERCTLAELAARGWPMGAHGPVHDGDAVPHDHPRWPTHCACGYVFEPGDYWQANPDTLFRRGDTGELITLDAAPVGAIWRATWFEDRADAKGGGITQWTGPDGRCYVCRLPAKKGRGHDWIIDSVASNCDSPCGICKIPRHKHASGEKAGHYYVDGRPHKCWIRQGEPPGFTVGKSGGATCGAGGGSILTQEKWHGFLTAGYLVGKFE